MHLFYSCAGLPFLHFIRWESARLSKFSPFLCTSSIYGSTMVGSKRMSQVARGASELHGPCRRTLGPVSADSYLASKG